MEPTGKTDKNGTDGQDGVGIDTITINQNDELEITLSSGTELNLGMIKGSDGTNGKDRADGKDGIGISGKLLSMNRASLLFPTPTERQPI